MMIGLPCGMSRVRCLHCGHEQELGIPIYRALLDYERAGRWSWWARDRAYAESYGEEVIEGRLPLSAAILDLSEAAVDEDGWISGAAVEACCGEGEAGLCEALGLEADDRPICEASRLWDVADGRLDRLADWLSQHGYDGLCWWQDEGRTLVYLLLQE